MVKYQDVEDFRAQKPNWHFIKVKNKYDESGNLISGNLLKENFIPDYYEPEFPKLEENDSTVIFPLAISSFPDVLSHISATQAGIYALNMIEKQHWDETYENICSCLVNLEMDWR